MKAVLRSLTVAALVGIGVIGGVQSASAGRNTVIVRSAPDPVEQGGTFTVTVTDCPAGSTVDIVIGDLGVNAKATEGTGPAYTLQVQVAANAPLGEHVINATCDTGDGIFNGVDSIEVIAAPTTTQAATTTTVATTTTGAILAETGSGGSTSTMAALAVVAILLGGGLVLFAARARSHA